MADFPSRTELLRAFRAGAMAVQGTRLSAREIDREGSDLNLIAAAATLMGEAVVHRIARAYSGVFEDTATKERLDRVVFDRKGLPRQPAYPAVVTLSLSRAAATAGAGTIQGGVRGSSPAPARIRKGGIVYYLTESASFGALDLGPVEVVAEAELAGTAYQVAAGDGWQWVDAIFDSTIAATNAEDAAGASDEETDEQYRARAKDYFPGLSKATLRALLGAARSASGVSVASVAERIDADGAAARVVEAFVLDALGTSNQALAERTRRELISTRALGIPVVVSGGVPDYVSIEFTGVEFDTALVEDTADCFRRVQTAIVSRLQNQVPGQKLLRTTILAAARSVPGFLCEDSDLTDPLGTLTPSDDNVVLRTKPELITLVP